MDWLAAKPSTSIGGNVIPLAGFCPDVDPTTSGVLLDCTNLVPTLIGMEGAPTLKTPSGVPVLAAACLGAAVVSKLDGSRRVFAGTQTKIYELSGGAWVDRSSGTYTGSTESYWSICQFGDATLMANKADAMQRSTTGVFAAVSGAPKAEILYAVGSQVMALNTDTSVDQWWCCGTFDETTWTPSITTQAGNGRLVSQPGAITAGARLGEYATAYKNKSLYIGQYVGGAGIWDWRQVRGGNAGCVGKRALCDVDGIHFFVGEDNLWMFDGTNPVSVADGVIREWFNSNCSSVYRYKTICVYDKPTNLVWVFFVSTNSAVLDSAIVYHVITKKWGRVAVSVEAVLEYVTSSMTIDGLDASYSTIDSLPEVPFDSAFWNDSARALAAFNTSHQLQTFQGECASSTMTTSEYGDDHQVSLLQRIKLRFKQEPIAATLTSYHKMNSGENFAIGQSVNMTGAKFDLLQSARWHKAVIAFTGPIAITGQDATITKAGME